MNDVKQSEANGGIDLTVEEMAERLGDQRRDLLSVLNRSDDSSLNTSDLRMAADVPSGSMTHHMKTLQRWELVEEVDRIHVGGGSRAIVWGLTQAGEEFIADGGLESGRRVARVDDIDALQEDIADLNQRMNEVEADNDQIKDYVMQIGVHTGTFTRQQAKEIMGEERFRNAFETDEKSS